MNSDNLTTISGLIAIVAIAFHEHGIAPDFTGLIAAIAAGCFALLTNHPISRSDRNQLR